MRPWIPLAVAFAAANFSPYLTPLILGATSDSLGLSADQAGLLTSLEFVGLGLASLALAPSVHRLDRRRLTLLGGALAAAGHLLAAFVDGYGAMLPVRFAVGVGEGLMLAATNATIAAAEGSARVYARCILTTILTASVGYAVCPTAIAAWGHRGAHGCVAVVLFLALLVVARAPSARPPSRALPSASRIVRWLLAMTLLVTLSDGLVWPFAERIGNSLGIDGELLGWMLGASLAAGLFGAGAAERLGTRFGYVRPLLISLWGTALAGWGMANSGASATLFATTVAKNVTILFFFPYLLGLAAALDRTGRTAAAVTGAMPLGVAAGPWLGGLVVEAAGFAALGWGGLLGALLATGILLRARGNLGSGGAGCYPRWQAKGGPADISSFMAKISRALIAPFDKTGIEAFAQALHQRGIQLIATSGTARRLREADLPVTEVSEHTGFPEMLGGRVKTLHPKIHGGLLGRREDPEHTAQMQAHGIPPIDLLCLNLYPFVATIRKPDATFADAVEMIDIGGPAMLRAAAKNHKDVIALIDSADYDEFLRRLDGDELDPDYRRKLAAKAYAHTAEYDAAIAAYMAGEEEGPFAATLTVTAQKVQELRYGENPHQRGAVYRTGVPGLATAEQLNGKALSYINLLDAAGAYTSVSAFPEPGAVVVKHANPCGAATAADLSIAFENAWEGDPVSAFGSILAFNREVTPELADRIAAKGFVEVVVAPDFAAEALSILKQKPKWGKNVRLLKSPLPERSGLDIRSIPGGFLVQERDGKATDRADLKVVTKRAPSDAEIDDLVFAQRVCKHVKSNAIVLARGGMVVGVGAGQMSRVDAARLAAAKAGERAKGAVFASDAFLPFNDALEVALDAGATAAIQPGGSKNDERCIQFADERGIAMVFTGTRHFLH